MNPLTFYNRDFSDGGDYTLRDVVEGLGYDLGLTSYPIFDENYREKLNTAIINHFWYRRIASDTPQMFIFYLNRMMNEKMPTYNAIYKYMAKSDIDPFLSGQTWTDYENLAKGETHEQTAQDSTSKTTNSTTPQVWLENPEGTSYMDALAQADTNTSGKGDSNSLSDNKGMSKTRVLGDLNQSVYQLIDSGIINPDTLVFDMLEPLFLQYLTDEPY